MNLDLNDEVNYGEAEKGQYEQSNDPLSYEKCKTGVSEATG